MNTRLDGVIIIKTSFDHEGTCKLTVKYTYKCIPIVWFNHIFFLFNVKCLEHCAIQMSISRKVIIQSITILPVWFGRNALASERSSCLRVLKAHSLCNVKKTHYLWMSSNLNAFKRFISFQSTITFHTLQYL